MQKITLLVGIVFLMAISCNNPSEKNVASKEADARFDAYKERFVLALWQIYPGWASSQGFHKYDSVLSIPDQGNRDKEMAFCNAHLDSLKNFELSQLSDNNKTDLHLIENQLQSTIWSLTDEKSYEWNPSGYNVSGSFAEMLANNYAPIEERLHNFYTRMAQVPAFYAAAKQNIKNPTIEHTQLAIDQNLGGISVFEQDLNDALKTAKIDDAQKQQITTRAKETVAAIKDFADWLKKSDNKTPRSFRLGKELYAKRFGFDIQSAYTAEAIYHKAIQHRQELHEKMFGITQKLWPKYFGTKQMPADKLIAIRQMIDTLSVKHVKPDSFQSAIEAQIPVLVKFIKDKNLVYLDSTKPLVVRKEPAYMAGVAGASISAPGPYDKNGNTYYNVGSLAAWPKERAESYLREYNHYILQILNIHEAIPGHYVQLIYSNQSPSIIKSILGNGAMVEGWAVYTERMMLENGYGAETPGGNESSPEMWLMYYKWNMRSTCNTILDYSVHSLNMSKEEAIKMLTEQAFQQQAEAENKWKRVSVTQVQLCCYFTGYTEIYELREEMKNKLKDKFDLKAFHEKFLSYGSSPVKYIEQMMMEGK